MWVESSKQKQSYQIDTAVAVGAFNLHWHWSAVSGNVQSNCSHSSIDYVTLSIRTVNISSYTGLFVRLHRHLCSVRHIRIDGGETFSLPLHTHTSHTFNLFEFIFSFVLSETAFSFPFRSAIFLLVATYLQSTMLSNQQMNERECMNDDTGKHVYKRIEQKKHISIIQAKAIVYIMVWNMTMSAMVRSRSRRDKVSSWLQHWLTLTLNEHSTTCRR